MIESSNNRSRHTKTSVGSLVVSESTYSSVHVNILSTANVGLGIVSYIACLSDLVHWHWHAAVHLKYLCVFVVFTTVLLFYTIVVLLY